MKNKEIALKIINDIRTRKYSFTASEQVSLLLDIKKPEINSFKSCWDNLVIDPYMADGGTYRYRRYGQFNKLANSNTFTIVPHESYIQPHHINKLNGGIERHFEPLTDIFFNSQILTKTLNIMSDIYDEAEEGAQNWNIRLHPYRIVATNDENGHPTPEGLHRDGVNYIATMMINRCNVLGGNTRITDTNKNELYNVTLKDTFDLVIANDADTMHEVSPISKKNTDLPTSRDVLVIAFTKINLGN